MNRTAIAIDLGGTAIKYGLTDAQGHVLWEDKRPTPLGSREEVIEALLQCISKASGACEGVEPCCVGLGTPGLVDYTTGYVFGAATQLPLWDDLPLGDILSRESGIPVFVDNDANLMGLGEFVFGSAKPCRDAIFITVGTGIGGAIFINGQLYRGSRNAGGELGCFPFEYKGEVGNWEDFVSMTALISRYQQATGHTSVAGARQIFELAARGDAAALSVIDENTALLGRGIGGYINVFNPERVIIGGGVSETTSDYIAKIKTAAFAFALPACCDNLEVVAASLGNKAGFVGAGYFALSMLKADS